MGKSSVKLVDDFPEFAENKRLHWIAEEWLRYADRLAEWTMERLVNRRDVWSQYIVKNGEVGVDIFRVENGKLVEHWDVIQAIPDNSKNNNTMF